MKTQIKIIIMTSKVIEGHIRPSGTFIHEPILMKICINANILKMQIFIK